MTPSEHHSGVWEERWHPLREEWVIVAAHRQNALTCALKLGPVPRLEAAVTIAAAPPAMQPFIAVGLTREINKLRAMIRAVRRELEH